jgi:hypothetical protein
MQDFGTAMTLSSGRRVLVHPDRIARAALAVATYALEREELIREVAEARAERDALRQHLDALARTVIARHKVEVRLAQLRSARDAFLDARHDESAIH